jgi:serine/threonine protein kinase
MQTTGDSRLGTTVEKYKLLSVLGAGSMSVVYLAQRLDDPGVLVAVKLLHYQGASSPEDHAAFRMRFLREARAASQLRNEYILPVLSSGDAGDLPYMVMPVIVGGTLTTRLTNQPQPMPLGEIARYLTQLANGIDYAHRQGIVHRDIKPANILLDEHGHVYLTDFGIARLFDSGDNALTREGVSTLTRTGQVLGTPYYMAPEQIQAGPVGPAADIYALGVVLYQMVTGQVPFHGDTPLAVALQHLQEVPNSPGLLRHELPPQVEAVILTAIAKNPADRYASATELAEDFQAGLTDLDDPMATRPPSETWPFSTRFASSASAIPAASAATPVPRPNDRPERLVGLTIDGYHLGAMIESDDLGAVFMADREGSAEPVRIRFLTLPPDATPKRLAGYLLRFEQQAHDLAALRHPNLAPVIGYGAYQGRPYLVMPDNQGIALSAELAQHGAQELSAISDCLDQVVAGLECAHRRGFLHLSLTPGRRRASATARGQRRLCA